MNSIRAILTLAALTLAVTAAGQTPGSQNTGTAPGSTAAAVAGQANTQSKNPVAPAIDTLARIDSVAEDRKTLAVDTAQRANLIIKVRVADLQERLKGFHAGDVVRLSIAGDEGDWFLTDIQAATATPSNDRRIVLLLVSLAVPLGAAFLLYGAKLTRLIVGFDGRYSKSKFQIAAWFAVLIATYIACLVVRAWSSQRLLWGGIDIPNNLLLLSGLSALSFAGAKGITSSKVDRGVLAKPRNPQAPKFWSDLLYDDQGRPDFGDFQMLVVTGLAIFTYLGAVMAYLGHARLSATTRLPDVDTTILSAFGLGQGAYLAKKALNTSPKPNRSGVTSAGTASEPASGV